MKFYRKNSDEKTALHIAVENRYAEIVKLLLSNPNIDINDKRILISFN